MGTTIAPKPSLLEEFQSLLKLITDGGSLTCHGITKKNQRCERKVSAATKKRLSVLGIDIVECLKNGCDRIEVLLREASSLAMCIQTHQFQAIDKYETWIRMIPLTTDESPLDDIETKSTLSIPAATSSEHLPLGSDDAEALEDPLHTSNHLHRSISPTSSFDDSGYISADEDTPIKLVRSDSGSKKQAAQGSMTPKKNPEIRAKTLTPKTPQRPSLPASADSGISMTIDASNDGQRGKVEPVSPLAYKGGQRNPFRQHSQLPQQAATPTQHNVLQNTICAGSCEPKHEKLFLVPFSNPAKKLTKYLRSPFPDENLEKGYLYVFQMDGTTSNKIGFVSKRQSDSSLESSFDHRMKEHENCGWKPKTVFKCKVLHAKRVEKIIHYHLEKCRQKQTDLCKGPTGAKCKHREHKEWFKAPLPEIVVSAMTWVHWMSTEPYVERNGTFVLKAEWHEKLDKIKVDHVSDFWLHWLNCHLPKKQDHADDPNKNGAPSIGTNISTIEDIPFRLKPGKTWPRWIDPGSKDKY